jgi:hypothetical protein
MQYYTNIKVGGNMSIVEISEGHIRRVQTGPVCFFAEHLRPAGGTLVVCGTVVGNHWSRQSCGSRPISKVALFQTLRG